jgi:hypothetical protein
MLRGISEPEKVAELFATALSAHGRVGDAPERDGDRS